MAIFVQVFVFGISLFFLQTSASPTNWFYTAPRALFGLAGSASASASAPATHGSFIADLRKKAEKSEQLQQDKGLTEQEQLLEQNSDGDGGSRHGDGGSEENNEASPSLLQKKIGKILTKLRLIAQIKNAYHYRPEIDDNESNITFTSQVNITDLNSDENVVNTNGSPMKNTTEEITLEPELLRSKTQSENIQSIPPAEAYGIPKERIARLKEQSRPITIELDINEINDQIHDFDSPKSEKIKDQEPGKLGALGIFFAELLGSIVGLTYGAFAQIGGGGQSPVALTTSEGLK